MPLRTDQVRRYARHILLPDIGGVGQERLLQARVAVRVGPGCDAEIAALAYLAAAGVGTLALSGEADGPVTAAEVASGILYGAADVGRPRREAISERLRALNPDVTVVRDSQVPDGDDGDADDGTVDLETDPLAAELPPPPGLPPAPGAAAAPLGARSGLAVADALMRGGAAAARLIHTLATCP
jgi:molybdopterin-synthase adenylyltransferase